MTSFDALPKSPPDSPAAVVSAVQSIVTGSIDTIQRVTGEAVTEIDEHADRASRDLEGTIDRAGEAVAAAADQATRQLRELLKLIQQLANTIGANLPDLSIGSVNDAPFYTPVDGHLLFTRAVATKVPTITLVTHEPAVIKAFESLAARTPAEFRDRMVRQFRERYHPLPQPAPTTLS